jgi:hypothetical protein
MEPYKYLCIILLDYLPQFHELGKNNKGNFH